MLPSGSDFAACFSAVTAPIRLAGQGEEPEASCDGAGEEAASVSITALDGSSLRLAAAMPPGQPDLSPSLLSDGIPLLGGDNAVREFLSSWR